MKRISYLPSMSNYNNEQNNKEHSSNVRIQRHTNTRDEKYYIIKYMDLLKTLASDFKILKLNERFHCCHSGSIKYSLTTILNVFTIMPVVIVKLYEQ